MQTNKKFTHVRVRPDKFKAVTSTIAGHNNDAVAFNLELIQQHYPRVARKLVKIFDRLPWRPGDES